MVSYQVPFLIIILAADLYVCIREQGLPEKKTNWECDDPEIVLHKKVFQECQKKKNDFAILYNGEIIDKNKKVHEFRDTTNVNRLIIVVTKDLCKKYKLLVIYFINAISPDATCNIRFPTSNKRQTIKVEKNQKVKDLITACHLEKMQVTIKHNGDGVDKEDFVIKFNLDIMFSIGKPIQNGNLLFS